MSTQTDLFRAAHEAVSRHYGDREQAAAVVISTRSGLRIKLDVPHWCEAVAPSPPPTRLTPPLPSGCTNEILQTLRAVGHRLTGEQLQHEMELRGWRYSDSKLRLTAGVMVELGVLTNDQESNPKGYGLPEWAS